MFLLKCGLYQNNDTSVAVPSSGVRRLRGSCVFCAPLDRYIGRHIDRLSTDVSVDISVECRPICRPIYRLRVSRYVGRYMSVDLSTDVYRPSDGRHIDRLSADISVDIAADTRPICRPLTVGGVSVDCRWYIGRVSYNISQNLRLSVTDVYKAVASLRRRR